MLISLVMCGDAIDEKQQIEPGIHQFEKYLDRLKDKNIGLVVNHTSLIDDTHLLDTLLSYDINVIKIFSPEHGFRGTADAGQHLSDNIDEKTGLPIISLYGKNRKPPQESLSDVDVIVFDIQDVGVRFYTYISTLTYVMEAAAEASIPVIVLDRPNPNGHYVDGPVLEDMHQSFVGLHPVPIVYGMTMGEYALMVNGEKWLKDTLKCELTVIECANYAHDSLYQLPIAPSPNLPNMRSVYLYPSLCFFEGTPLNAGRGTDFPFQVFGHPELKNAEFTYTPVSKPGASMNPKLKGELCYGINLTGKDPVLVALQRTIDLEYLIFAYQNMPDKTDFFIPYFENLAGTTKVRQQIIKGIPEDEIQQSWKEDIENFHKIRKKYLLYPDFTLF